MESIGTAPPSGAPNVLQPVLDGIEAIMGKLDLATAGLVVIAGRELEAYDRVQRIMTKSLAPSAPRPPLPAGAPSIYVIGDDGDADSDASAKRAALRR